jgi:hypothetical protein
MQGYSKWTLRPFSLVYYKGYVESSMLGYSKGSLGPFILVYFNG